VADVPSGLSLTPPRETKKKSLERIYSLAPISANRRKDEVLVASPVICSLCGICARHDLHQVPPHATVTCAVSIYKRMACGLGYWGTTSKHVSGDIYDTLFPDSRRALLKSIEYCDFLVCCHAKSVAVIVGSSYEQEQNMAGTDTTEGHLYSAGIAVSFMCVLLYGALCIQPICRPMAGWYMNDKFERTWKQAVVE
jgi:hypothetical protein